MTVILSGDVYPVGLLEGLDTALMGFCAAFLGRQDCVWVADAGITATAVDHDAVMVAQMREIYPDDWTFICDDVFHRGRMLAHDGARFDLVSLDPYSNHFQRTADMIDVWAILARRVIVVGHGRDTELRTPDGWQASDRVWRSHRFGGTYWTAFTRC